VNGLRVFLAVALAATSLAACASTTQSKGDGGFRVRHLPPGDRDVFEALLSMGGMELKDPTCKNVGRDASDTTVGAYLSGFLVEMNQPTGGNHLVIEHVSESADAWIVRAMLRHSEGDDEWGWGIEVAIRKKDGTLDPASLRCIGAG
jgi:hypothetical protein